MAWGIKKHSPENTAQNEVFEVKQRRTARVTLWSSETELTYSRGTGGKSMTNLGQTLESSQRRHGLAGHKLRCGGAGKFPTVASGKSQHAHLLNVKPKSEVFRKQKGTTKVVYWCSETEQNSVRGRASRILCFVYSLSSSPKKDRLRSSTAQGVFRAPSVFFCLRH